MMAGKPPIIVEIKAADFSVRGVWSDASATIVAASAYASVPTVVDVRPGDKIEWVDVPELVGTYYVLAAYDTDGNAVAIKSNRNRWQYTDIDETFSKTVPAGVYKIGFIWQYSVPFTSTSKIIVTKYQ